MSRFRAGNGLKNISMYFLFAVFLLSMKLLSKFSGLSTSLNITIAAIIVISLAAYIFFKARKVIQEVVNDDIENENYLCQYAVRSNVLDDFGQHFRSLNRDNMVPDLILGIGGILIFAITAIILGLDIILAIEITAVVILLVMLFYKKTKKNMEFAGLDEIQVSISMNFVVINGKQTVWNSDMEKITDVILRKINEQSYYVTVYYNQYSDFIDNRRLNYLATNPEGIGIEEMQISIPVPASEKERVQEAVHELRKIKVVRKF